MNIPCLAINSGNDPIVLPEFVPQERLNENQNIISLMVGGGGHVEYCSGIKARFWCVDIAIQFFKSLYELQVEKGGDIVIDCEKELNVIKSRQVVVENFGMNYKMPEKQVSVQQGFGDEF